MLELFLDTPQQDVANLLVGLAAMNAVAFVNANAPAATESPTTPTTINATKD